MTSKWISDELGLLFKHLRQFEKIPLGPMATRQLLSEFVELPGLSVSC
jgi:hypothetical protein